MNKNTRPVYLNLPKLAMAMSITGKISILHRISGALMVLAIPYVLYLLDQSLHDAEFYTHVYTLATTLWMKAIYLILIWALLHHICAGIRYLFLDIHIGVDKKSATVTARYVLIISLLLTIVAGYLIW